MLMGILYCRSNRAQRAEKFYELVEIQLTDQLEVGLKRFSNGEIEQPVRAMLPISEHSGFLGK